MITLIILVGVLALATYFVMKMPAFGSDPEGDALTAIQESPQYNREKKIFENIEHTVTLRPDVSKTTLFWDFLFNKSKTIEPPKPLPFVKTDLNALESDVPTVAWFGHSAYLIKHKGFTLLMDPVFSGYAAPLPFFGNAFKGANEYDVAQMPPIDVLVISHDHYDHLDYSTIRDIHPKVKQFVVPLGVGAHLRHWNVPAEKITELDWWQSKPIADSIQLTATPARHFSGRGFTQAKTLWASYVLELNGYKLFLGGDSGYDGSFKKIGDKFGPFDIAFLECGQYGVNWPTIHMMPEETATAARDLKADVLMPVHWAKFVLSTHAWDEPVERVTKAARELQQKVTTPLIGQPIRLRVEYPDQAWWKQVQ